MPYSGLVGLVGTESITQSHDCWTLAFVPDPQKLATDNIEGYYNTLIQYVVDEKTSRNIQMVIQIGDSVDTGNDDGEWTIANTAMNKLDGEVDYMVAIGNHDYDDDTGSNRTATRFDTTYPLATHNAMTGAISDVYPTGKTHNTAIKKTIGAFTYLIINIEYLPRTAAITWAEDIITDHGTGVDYIFVATHDLLDKDGVRQSDTELTDLWNDLLSQDSRIRLVLSGHVGDGGSGLGVAARRTDGNVHQHVLNYQTFNGDIEDTGLVRFYTINQADHSVSVTTYNPITDTQLTDSQNQFTFNL